MPADYDAIGQDNLQDHEALVDRVGALLSSLYSDQTQFIFELLQNAEDVNATRVMFTLYDDRLEFEHDGRDFDERDVKAICKLIFGTKADDLGAIGKFGIGFMSVYNFTRSPSIHSGNEHFTIRNYEQPLEIPAISTELGTRFIFPFDHRVKRAGDAFDEIALWLRELDIGTLLFLRHIREISYDIVDADSGVYLRQLDEDWKWKA